MSGWRNGHDGARSRLARSLRTTATLSAIHGYGVRKAPVMPGFGAPWEVPKGRLGGSLSRLYVHAARRLMGGKVDSAISESAVPLNLHYQKLPPHKIKLGFRPLLAKVQLVMSLETRSTFELPMIATFPRRPSAPESTSGVILANRINVRVLRYRLPALRGCGAYVSRNVAQARG
jgi:hypothetical protein